jgi:hypothetical protein
LKTEIPVAILLTASGSDQWSATARKKSIRALQRNLQLLSRHTADNYLKAKLHQHKAEIYF